MFQVEMCEQKETEGLGDRLDALLTLSSAGLRLSPSSVKSRVNYSAVHSFIHSLSRYSDPRFRLRV